MPAPVLSGFRAWAKYKPYEPAINTDIGSELRFHSDWVVIIILGHHLGLSSLGLIILPKTSGPILGCRYDLSLNQLSNLYICLLYPMAYVIDIVKILAESAGLVVLGEEGGISLCLHGNRIRCVATVRPQVCLSP